MAALASLLAPSAISPPRIVGQTGRTLTGEFRTHPKFRSKFLATERDVLVYLPPGYGADPRRRYPVLYMHDGQNLFDGSTSFIRGQEWRADETAQELITAGRIEPLIIVGVYNAGEARTKEYTPVFDPKRKDGGRAAFYGRFLVEELKPFVDANYLTKAGAADTGLGGSSLGGLVSLYLGLRYPHVFGKLAVVSPSVWWADRFIVRDVRALTRKVPARIWLDTGTEEAEGVTEDARLLRDALVAEGWRVGKDLGYFEAAGARHNEAAWAARFGRVLRFLFPARP